MKLLLQALALLLLLAGTAAAEPPTRVVSTSPAMTEIVYTLGREASLIAVTDYCRWPPEASEKARIGGLFDTNTERLLALQPDLVLLTPYHRDLQPRLARAGIETTMIRIETIEDIFSAVEQLGLILGAVDEPAAINLDRRTRLKALEEAAPPMEERPRVLLFLGSEETPLRNAMGIGRGEFLHDMLEAAGGRNMVEDSPVPYPQLSLEALIRKPPDVVVFLGGDPFPNDEARAAADRLARQRWNSRLGYVTEDFPRFVFLRGDHPQIPGPTFIEHAEYLAEQLAPEE